MSLRNLLAALAVGLMLATGSVAQAGVVVAGDLLVNLDAQGLPLGLTVTPWTNQGSLVGDFAVGGTPVVEDVNDGMITARATRLDGIEDWFDGPNTDARLEGASDRTIEVWVHNPAILAEETIVAWSRRNGPTGTNMSFNYGDNPDYGAVGHWGWPDLGWNGVPAAGQWHHLVYTFDGATDKVYADGVLKNSDGPLPINSHAGFPIRVGAQNADPAPVSFGSLDIAVVRIHDGVLSAADVRYNYNAGITAIVSDGWLVSQQNGDWNDNVDPRTWDGTVPGYIPTADTAVEVDGHTVTIQPAAAAGLANTLDIINSGSVIVGTAQSLTVMAVDCEPGSSLTLNSGAVLTAHTGTIASLIAAGDATVTTGGSLAVTGYTDAGGNTLAKMGDGTIALTGATTVAGSGFQVAQGTLAASGASPLGNATSLTLSGGRFEFAGGHTVGAGPGGNLVAHWSFDQAPGSSTTAEEATGNYDGALSGGADFGLGGVSGNALVLDGVNSFVDLPDGFADFTGGISFAAWVKPDVLNNWSRIIDFANGAATDNILMANMGTTDTLVWEIYGANPGNQRHDVPAAIDLDRWQHFAATIDAANNVVIYKNGFPVLTNTQKLPSNVVRTINYIGESNWGGDAFFQGMMDEIYVYDDALTAPEVQAMATRTIAAPDLSNVNVNVTASSTLQSQSETNTDFASLTISGGTLTTAGTGGITFTAGTKIPEAATAVAFNPQVETQLGGITGGGAGPEVTITKTGSGELTLKEAGANLALATFEAQQGTLRMMGEGPLGGSTAIKLNGGMFAVSDHFAPPTTPAGAYGHWRFDETSGLTAFDTAGAPAHDGTLMDMNPAADWAPGRINNALDFDGYNDKVSVDSLGTDMSELTVSAWINPSLGGWRSIFHTKAWAAGDLHYIVMDGRILFACNGMGQQSGGNTNDFWSNSAIPYNEWTNVVSTYSVADHRVKIYINGLLDRETTFTGNNPVKFTNGFHIASNDLGNGRWMRGQLDELAIWNSVLSEAEIGSIYGTRTAADMSTANVTVEPGTSTLQSERPAQTAFAGLTMKDSATLITSGSAGFSFTGGTTIPEAATAVVFDARVPTDVGAITGGGAGPNVTITMSGTDELTFRETGANLAQATFEANQGTLKMVGSGALGGSTAVKLTGGTFAFSDVIGAPGTGSGPADGKVAHWKFDQDPGSGGPAVDQTGDYDGTLMGGADYSTDGMQGNSLVLDGIDSWVDLPDGMDSWSQGICVAAWVKPQALNNWSRIIDFANGAGDNNILMANMQTTNTLVWEIYGTNPGNQRHDVPNAIDLNQWQHFAASIDASNNVVIYKNGVPVLTNTQKLPSDLVRVNNYIGQSNWPDALFQGLIDELYIYNRGLTAAEVGEIYASRTAPDMSAVNVTVEPGTSTLESQSTVEATFSGLTMKNAATLTTSGLAGIRFAGGTSIAAGATAVAFDTQVPTNPGAIDGSGALNVVITKTGAATLTLDTAGTSLSDLAMIDVQEGLVEAYHGSNPFDRATLRLRGGNLLLSAKAGIVPVSVDYENAVIVEGTGTVISAGQGTAGQPAPMTVNLGSATKSMAVNADLELKSTDGYELNVAGNLGGTATVAVNEGTVILSGTASTVGALDAWGGSLSTAGQDVTLTKRLRSGDCIYTVDTGNFKVRGADLVSHPDQITLTGNVLTIAPAGVPEGPLAHWKFDEAPGSGGPAADETGNYDGTLMGGADYSTDAIQGNALILDGVDSWVDLPDGMDSWSQGISVAAWVKPQATNNWSRVIDFGNGPNSDNILMANEGTSNNLVWEIHGANPGNQRQTVPGAIDLDQWQHFAASVDASNNVVIYKNGAPVLTGTQKLPSDLVRINNYIGQSNWADALFQGLMDDLLIYGRGLSPQEVGLLYNGGNGPDYSADVQQPDTDVLVTATATLSSPAEAVLLRDLTVEDPAAPPAPQLTLDNAYFGFRNVTVQDGTKIIGDMGVTGNFSVGSSIGTLTYDGELELAEATYLCEVDSTGADLIENLHNDKPIVLGEDATLELLLLEALGDDPGCYRRTILNAPGAGGIEEDFGTKPDAGIYLDFGVFLDSYDNTATHYDVLFFQAGQGDTDGDGDVDLDDLSRLDDGWDPTAEDKLWTDGDVDGDGDVDLDDLSLLDDAWAPAGYPVVNCPFGGGGLGGAPVPEPGTLALLAIGLLGLALWRWRRALRG